MHRRSVPLHRTSAERIVLIKPSALGDIIHALPVLTALRRRFPAARISWVVNRHYANLLEGHPDLDEVIAFERGATREGLLHAVRLYQEFFRQLHERQFDLAIDLQGLVRSGLMMAATAAARRIGLANAREGAPWFYTDRIKVPRPQAIHAVDRYWLIAAALGAGDGPKQFTIPISAPDHLWASTKLADLPRPWLMVGVGARWQTKRWPPEHFTALLHKAQERWGGTAVFVGGPDETPVVRLICRKLRGQFLDLTGGTTLRQLAAVLDRADVMLANDTGPLHLAAALGRPVVAPYTCTKVVRTGPYGALASAVETRVWCQGSYLKQCSRLDCMTELMPFRLWPVLQETLQAWEKSCRSA